MLIGEQTLQLLVIEKVLDDKYEISDKEVDEAINEMKEQFGEDFDAIFAQQGHTEEELEKNPSYQLVTRSSTY